MSKFLDLPIDNDVPLPDGYECWGSRRWIYPFGEMEVGDSFLVVDRLLWVRAANAAVCYGRNRGKRFVSRRVPHGDGQAVRIWRVK